MASLYKRSGSPFWWVKYRDPSGKIIRESTGFKIGIGIEFGKARQRRAECALLESKTASYKATDAWESWVPSYLAMRYATSARTLERMQHCWRFVSLYLHERSLIYPQQLTREIILQYVPWRRKTNRAQGFNGVSHNAALLDLKVLSVLMGEALKRGIVQANCCRDLGLRKTSPEPKAEMSDEEIAKIRAEISKRNTADYPYATKYDWGHFLRVSFEIAIHQGCRISETYLHVHRDVDLQNMAIRFKAKGDRYYETALNPGLVPLIKELRASGRTMTFDMPKQRTMLSLVWHKFLRRIGLTHLTFHSTRVTAVSRLERAGAPEAVVMQLVNHASTTVHRIYRRVTSRELSSFWPSMQAGPPASETAHGSQPDPGSPSATPERGASSSANHNQNAGPDASTSGP